MSTIYADAKAALIRARNDDPTAAADLADEIAKLAALGTTDGTCFARQFLDALQALPALPPAVAGRVAGIEAAIAARPAQELAPYHERRAQHEAYWSPEAVAARAAAEEARRAAEEAAVPPLERARRALRERQEAARRAAEEAARVPRLFERAVSLGVQAVDAADDGYPDGAVVLLADAAEALREAGDDAAAERAVDLALELPAAAELLEAIQDAHLEATTKPRKP